MEILLLIISGAISGILSGMLGIGGGLIIVPTLYFLFHYQGLFETHIMQVAASTSLAISLLLSLSASVVQHYRKTILYPALLFLIPGLIIGSISGAILAHFLSSELIRHIFGIGAILMGIYFMFPKLPHLHIASSPNRSLSFFGVIIGTCSSLLGIGGGILTFPILLGYGMNAKNASATSSCITAISCFLGTITYLLLTWKDPQINSVIGYIDPHSFLIIGISSLLTVHLGIKLAHLLNTSLIKQIFGICLSFVGLTMIIF